MRPTTFAELRWIHDCDLLAIRYATPTKDDRVLTLSMRCPTDLGYPPWEGKTLRLTASGVRFMVHDAFGVVVVEMVDSIQPRISESTRERTLPTIKSGGRFPTLECSISFNSGSSLEFICEGLQISVEP